MTFTCPSPETWGICSLLNEVSQGLGLLITAIAQSVPVLLIVVAVVGIIAGIGFGLKKMLSGAIGGKHY